MKKLFVFLVAVFASVILAAQTSPFAGLKIQGYKITSIWPQSFREVRGSVDVSISNTETVRVVRNVRANVLRNGSPFASGVCSDVTFLKGTNKYPLTGRVKLADGVSVWAAIGAALSFNPAEYMVEISMMMTHETGKTETITRTVPATRFFN